MRLFRNRIGNKVAEVAASGLERHTRKERYCDGRQCDARLGRGMLREVLCRLARVVIVRPMLVVMMARPFHVIDLVGNVKRFLERKLAVLHSKAVQRKQEHQENAENVTHGDVIGR